MVERKCVLVQDEIAPGVAKKDVRWAMLTAANVKIEAGRGRTAALTQGERKLTAQILEPAGARFATAEPDNVTRPKSRIEKGRRLLA
jgi:hypothetical protein